MFVLMSESSFLNQKRFDQITTMLVKMLFKTKIWLLTFVGGSKCNHMLEKSSPIVSKSCLKSSHNRFDFNRDIFKTAKKVVKYFGYFCDNIWHHDISKVAQSGHTGGWLNMWSTDLAVINAGGGSQVSRISMKADDKKHLSLLWILFSNLQFFVGLEYSNEDF